MLISCFIADDPFTTNFLHFLGVFVNQSQSKIQAILYDRLYHWEINVLVQFSNKQIISLLNALIKISSTDLQKTIGFSCLQRFLNKHTTFGTAIIMRIEFLTVRNLAHGLLKRCLYKKVVSTALTLPHQAYTMVHIGIGKRFSFLFSHFQNSSVPAK